MGFQELKPAAAVAPRDVEAEQPVLFFTNQGPSGDGLRVITLRVVKPDSPGSSTISLASVDASRNGRSWGTNGSEYDCRIGDAGYFQFKASPLDSPGRFRITSEWRSEKAR